ncbi:Panacea domain-containing protein [Novosphingobium album (ex Hu et al. 2023)]|uniref:DUF4065 domain-containing protein n=1 Tax=Novosphingobium album (ex Hu et al. 2023) TaxID=2930093 RepID=A0ABT0B1Q8_9SPHN|nr:type II toxin-antitoxin system antitoxin SocA domain-containing protein [Novosphingobium album (ex Hu et al. 2023)]MCJ2178869.1 DUF4065 domain-containing protein [Novosphingobium album (ex Hu et al. 2023)]
MTLSRPHSDTPPYDIKGLANLFLDWADEDGIPITPMKIQKILYFSHADYLQITGTPLASQSFEAWDFGPVDPSVFEEFRRFSKAPIQERAYRFDPIAGKRVLAKIAPCGGDLKILRSLYNFYKRASATALSDMSHDPNGPWAMARHLFEQGKNADRRMSDKLIVSYHQSNRPS